MDQHELDKAISKEIATIPVELPTNRRPVIFDRLMTIGLRAIRMGMEPEEIGRVRDALVRAIVSVVDRHYRAEIGSLQERILELEDRLDGVWSDEDMAELWECHRKGMSVTQLCHHFNRSRRDIRAALKGTARVRKAVKPETTES